MPTGTYQIVESKLSVAGIGYHGVLTLQDSAGNVIRELDGLATNKNGDIKPIGFLPSDTLKVYEF